MTQSLRVLTTFCELDDMQKLAEKHVNIIECVEHLSAHLLHILKHVDRLTETLYSTSKLYRRLTFFMHLEMTNVEYEFYEQTYRAEYHTTLVNMQNVKELVDLCNLVHDTWESKLMEIMLILNSERETHNKVYNKIDIHMKKAEPVLNSYQLVEDILHHFETDEQEIEIAEFCKIFFELHKLQKKTS